MKPVYYFFFDTLCGWCYGFNPVIQKIHQEYQKRFDFKIISGGLAIGDRAAPVGEKYSYIEKASKTVEELSGVKFGDRFFDLLKDGTYIIDSVPPAIALAIVKDKFPDKSFEFADALHNAFFGEGKNMNINSSYYEIAEKFGWDGNDFVNEMREQKYQDLAVEDFKLAYHFGIQGFPTCVLKKDDQYFMVNHGYRDFNEVKRVVEEIMNSTSA